VKTTVLESGRCGAGKPEAATRQAAEKLDIDVESETVTDLPTIIRDGIMSTPALIVDGQIRLAGRTRSVDEVASVLTRGLA